MALTILFRHPALLKASAELLFLLGRSFVEGGRHAEALEPLEAALAKDPRLGYEALARVAPPLL